MEPFCYSGRELFLADALVCAQVAQLAAAGKSPAIPSKDCSEHFSSLSLSEFHRLHCSDSLLSPKSLLAYSAPDHRLEYEYALSAETLGAAAARSVQRRAPSDFASELQQK